MRKMMRSKRSRKHRGGHMELIGSRISNNYMLLPGGMENKAALNHEWSLAKDPNAFAPRA